jgi:isopropylmalate/citramalate/homocitrate synthase-like protein
MDVYDSTLRDGEQTPGVCFSKDQKLHIAYLLDELGINMIDAGFPVVSKAEQEAITAISKAGLDTKVFALARLKKSDIDLCLNCDIDGILLFVGTSNIHIKHKYRLQKNQILEMISEHVEYAKEHGLFVQFTCEDATRTDFDFLIEAYSRAVESKADRIGVADTVGCAVPTMFKALIARIKAQIKVPIAVHCHNDFGLAVANSIIALESGAVLAAGTINGLGERAGNAATEELITILKYIYKAKDYNTQILMQLSNIVAKYSKIPVGFNKAIIGKNAFTHESGIHVAAVLEYPPTYEPIDPEEVGQKRSIIFGKHSGKKAIKSVLEHHGIYLDNNKLDNLLIKVKRLAEKGVKITDKVVISLIS